MAVKASPIPPFKHERLFKRIRVNMETECWEWTGSLSSCGYGNMNIAKKIYMTHRLSFDLFKGLKGEFLVIDHICRNRKCCNPEHLREVSARTNIVHNSEGASAKNALKTKCPKGHPYDKLIPFTRNGKSKKQRACSICIKELQHRNKKKYYEARRKKIQVNNVNNVNNVDS